MRVLLALLAAAIFASAANAADHEPIGSVVSPQPGWVQFCTDYPLDCARSVSPALDVVLTPTSWRNMVKVNEWVNHSIKPKTDLEHWGVVDKWSYPDDGYGDCEDFALLKRRMLLQAGWPRSALLMTVVLDTKGLGHAVLTIVTDRGDYVLDDLTDEVKVWSETGYTFKKR